MNEPGLRPASTRATCPATCGFAVGTRWRVSTVPRTFRGLEIAPRPRGRTEPRAPTRRSPGSPSAKDRGCARSCKALPDREFTRNRPRGRPYGWVCPPTPRSAKRGGAPAGNLGASALVRPHLVGDRWRDVCHPHFRFTNAQRIMLTAGRGSDSEPGGKTKSGGGGGAASTATPLRLRGCAPRHCGTRSRHRRE